MTGDRPASPTGSPARSWRRRHVLGALGGAGVTALSGCSSGQERTGGGRVTVGATIPQSGLYEREGRAQQRGFELAVSHLNRGGGMVPYWSDLTGNGVRGRPVELVMGDSAGDPINARRQAAQLIAGEGADVLAGGSSSAVALAVQAACAERTTPYLCGVAHRDTLTGASCSRYGFRELFNATMSARALAAVLREDLGSDRTFAQLYADYPWGREQRARIHDAFTTRAGWQAGATTATPPRQTDYGTVLDTVPSDRVDVLVLTHYGLDAARILTQARRRDLHEAVTLVVPLYSRLLARVAPDALGGVYATAGWNWQLRNDAAIAFVEAYRERFEAVPSWAAHLAYVQTIQYAAAAERAETTESGPVVRALEGHTYDGGGLGSVERLRACDHQAMRDVPVVRGVSAADQVGPKSVDVVDVVDREQVGYGCRSGPAAACELDR